MRERLTAAFVAIALVALVVAGFVRSYVVSGELREREGEFVAAQARVIGQVVGREGAEQVDEEFLRQFVVPGLALRYEQAGEPDLVLVGPDFEAEPDAARGVSATVFTENGALTVTRAEAAPLDVLWRGDLRATLAVFVLIGLVAGLVGYIVARSLSEPFRRLALAAAALGRGRFDLDLPTSRVPEARAIAQALDSSAAQLRDRLEREREFGLLASHVLRTPLTALRLNLEELVSDPDLPAEARETATSCLATVSRLGEVAGELVEVSVRGVLVAEAAVSLRDLATQVAQRWSDELEDSGRVLTAAIEGDVDVLFTPGPVEQVLDLVLEEVLGRHAGDVRLVFEGQPTTLAVDITCESEDRTMVAPEAPSNERTAALLAALGGLIEEPGDGSALRVLLPRR